MSVPNTAVSITLPPNCGTPGTPPCPPPDVFFQTRALVIDRLAGADATTEHRRAITAQVDTYLQAALRSAFVLMQGVLGHDTEGKDEPGGNGVTHEPGTDRRRRRTHLAHDAGAASGK